jgi:hypothetical protein
MNHMPQIKRPWRLHVAVLPMVCLLLAFILVCSGCSGNFRRELGVRGVIDSYSSDQSKDQQEDAEKER